MLRSRPDAHLSGTVEARLGAAGELALREPALALATGDEGALAGLVASGADAADTADAGRRSRTTGTVSPRVDVDSLDQRLNAVLEKLNRSFDEAERFGETTTAGLTVASERRKGDAATAPGSRSDAPGSHAAKARSEDVTRAVTPAADLDFADLNKAFKTLASTLEAQTSRAARDAADEANLADRIAALTQRFDTFEAPARTAHRPDSEMTALRTEVADLSARLAGLSPAGALSSLEAAVKDLTGRIDLSKLDGVKASVLAPVERLSRDMREAIRAADPSRLVEGLQRDMQVLTSKVAGLQGARELPALAAMQDELQHMRQSVEDAASRLALSGQLIQEVRALGARVDALAERTTPAVSRDLGQAVGDIRDLLQQFGSRGLLGAIDRRITTMASQIDGLAAQRAPSALLDDLSREIDRAHESLAARLEKRADPETLTRLEEQIGTLAAKIDAVGRTNHDVTALYGLVGELTNRIEEVRQPEADTQAINALQSQIGRLIERFDRSETGPTSLGGLERLIGDLFLQIEASRNVAIDAAENAARTAAQDTLRAALDNPALNGGELTVQTGLDVNHVSQELAELRRIQETSERRVNTTLAALNATLERLVDRMMADRARPDPKATVEAGLLPPRVDPTPEPRRRRRAATEDRPVAAASAPTAAFDPEQFLLEPDTVGSPSLASALSSASSLSSGAPMVDFDRAAADRTGGVSALIAAARRAAQLAQESAVEAAAKSEDSVDPDAAAHPGKVKSFFARRRRPLLLSLAGLVLLLGTLQVVRMSIDRTEDADVPAAGTAAAPRSPTTDVPAAAPLALPASPSAPAVAPVGDTSLLTAPPDASSASVGFKDKTGLASSAVPASAPIDPGQGLRDVAAGGNAAAQFELGARLGDGRGVARDPKEAALWFEKAAQQGLAPAQYRLGSVYEKGAGRTADPNLAIAWYEKAAAGGNVRAMHNLAVMLADGAGAKPDYGKAVTWFTKAASYGVRDSQFNLAVLFARGLGVPQNLGQSYAWFALAAQQGDPDAAKKRDTVAAKLDAKALADAKTTAESFKALTPDPAANDVLPPPGGWDAAQPKTASRKADARVSSM